MDRHNEDADVRVLDEQECWDELHRKEFGRLAFHLHEAVQLLPINYTVQRVGGSHRLVFRTAEGSKMVGTSFNPDVAFEIDEFDDTQAMSVVVRGRVHELHGDDALMVDQLPLRPWVPTEKHHVLAIEPTEVSGRRFRLARPWLTMTPGASPRPR